jgi:CDC48 subfamily AAA family ATPase
MAEKELKLVVAENRYQPDVGRGLARLPENVMKKLDVRQGDVVEITGSKPTGAIVVNGFTDDRGLDVVRIDGSIRRNAGTSIGEKVSVKKVAIKEAKSVTIAPADPRIQFMASEEIIGRNLFGRPIAKGDLITLGSSGEPVHLGADSFIAQFFGDFFGETATPFGLGEVKFVVTETSPSGIILVTENTDIKVLQQAVEVKELKVPAVTYEDIGGLKGELQRVREMIELPLKHPEVFDRLGIEPPKGVLLHGPPGTGKTLIARAVANESGANFISINGPEIMSKWYGESEAGLRKKFEDAEKDAPSIVFIDELDAIAPKREEVTGEVERRVVATLCTALDGLKSRGRVIVIGATNRPNALDPAIRRPGRFDREIEIGVPDRDGRKEVLQIHTRGMPIEPPFDPIVALNVINRSAIPDAQKKIIKTSPISDLRRAIFGLSQQEKETIFSTYVEQVKKDLVDVFARSDLADKKEAIDLIQSARDLDDLHQAIYSDLQRFDSRAVVRINYLIDKGVSRYLILDRPKKALDFNFNPDVVSNVVQKTDLSETLKKHVIEQLKKCKTADECRMIILGVNEETKSKVRVALIDNFMDGLANITHGFVGADLEALAKEAAMSALRRILPEIKLEEKIIPPEVLEKLQVTKEDFDNALRMTEPSAMREVLIEIPNVHWNDVGGLEQAKQELIEAVEWPLKYPDSFKRVGIEPPHGILLYGPPGTGKTMLARAVATESEANFISIKGPELLSKWVGESEKGVRETFRKAKMAAPAIVFFDEIDALVPRRGSGFGDSHVTERVISQLLTELDGLEKLENVVVIGATNRPDLVDPALLRPGRFDRLVLVPAPDEKARLEILKIHTKNMPLAKDVDLKLLAKETGGYSGSDIAALCREAAMLVLRKDIKGKEVRMQHFREAMKEIKPSLAPETMKAYESFTERKSKNITEEATRMHY